MTQRSGEQAQLSASQTKPRKTQTSQPLVSIERTNMQNLRLAVCTARRFYLKHTHPALARDSQQSTGNRKAPQTAGPCPHVNPGRRCQALRTRRCGASSCSQGAHGDSVTSPEVAPARKTPLAALSGGFPEAGAAAQGERNQRSFVNATTRVLLGTSNNDRRGKSCRGCGTRGCDENRCHAHPAMLRPQRSAGRLRSHPSGPHPRLPTGQFPGFEVRLAQVHDTPSGTGPQLLTSKTLIG